MVDEIRINDTIAIPLDAVEFQAVRAQGAGGQHVNKVASAIHLRFDYLNCEALPADLRRRLSEIRDSRITANGIVIKSQEHRTQGRNRQAAIERLQDLIRSALVEPKKRIPTRLSRSAKKKRLDSKRRQGQLKRGRGTIRDD
ncbi:MAG TPA: alternative ribosome rescue aminoacyl-tRNA hydrolase ArfB [Woeseiaceae bacterium]|nr:alternative ribosome rescue aminoacyl-tRNA hydrolase ArfB [Woeseiaceae bacterium]